MSVTVEVDTEGSLLTIGQGSREAAGAVQEIVQASGELGVVGLGSESERPVLGYRPRLGTKLCR
jgi:hypothetical protein